MSDRGGGGKGGWRKDTGLFLYYLPESERSKLARLWQPPTPGAPGFQSEEPKGWLSAARFGAGQRGKTSPQDRLMAALVERLEAGCQESGDWRQMEFDGEPVGFDPVSLTQSPSRFFYIPRPLAGLVPGAKGPTPPTRLISCRLTRATSLDQAPEELRFDLEAFVALRQGRLKIISDIRPGLRLLPGGQVLTRLSQLQEIGACLVAPQDGVVCTPMAAEWMNATLEQMELGEPGPHWPAQKELARVIKQWERSNASTPVEGWVEEGPGERFYCSMRPEWDSGERLTGLVTRHAERAIQWAEGMAARDADIRLGSASGPRLLSRLWRSRSPDSRSALSPSPDKMTLVEREAKRPAPAEADVLAGLCPAFDEAWGKWKGHQSGAGPAVQGSPLNVKRRIMS